MATAYVGIGSNLGKRQLALRTALERLRGTAGVTVTAVATFRETEPVDAPAGSGAFINSAVRLETTLSPEGLLDVLLQIERSLGRSREVGKINAPRCIDLDLLLYGEAVIETATLRLPHPRMHARRFVLEPLAEIGPEAVHPVLGKTMQELLADLPHSLTGE